MGSPLGYPLDALLRKLAEDTWENLREAKLLSVRFGEATITDTLMLELRRRGFRTFRQTTSRDEAKYGTDFECWIGSDRMGWNGYAVQSKKLDTTTGTYRNLGHIVKGSNKRQIDILRDYARARGLTARYCLYSHSLDVNPQFLRCCSRTFTEEELGCTITPLDPIERAILSRGRKRFRHLQSDARTVPWRCLAICPRLHGSSSSESTAYDEMSPLQDSDSIVYPRLPDELGALLEEDRRTSAPSLFDNASAVLGEQSATLDFEEFGIGVVSREMEYSYGQSPTFIIPRRVYILDIAERPTN